MPEAMHAVSGGTVPAPRQPELSPHGLSTALGALRYRLHEWVSSVDRTGRASDRERAEAEARRLAPSVEALLRGVARRYEAVRRAELLDGHPRDPAHARLVLERERQEAQREMYPHLRTLMQEGLERWLGLFLRGEFYETYRSLQANGAPLPDGLRVCESCALVFATRRKSGAERCAHCHHRPRSRAPLTMLGRPGGGYISRGLPGFNDGTRVVGVCEACGATFFAELASRTYCSAACRQGRPPPPKDPELTGAEKVACRAIAENTVARVLRHAEGRRANGEAQRIAACDRCSSYYPTNDPGAGRCPNCD